MQWLTIDHHNKKRAKLWSLRSVCIVRRLLVLLPNFVVVIEHHQILIKSFIWQSNITDINRDGWNITCRWWKDSYIFPRDNIFPQCCALRENIIPWENITLLAVHRNVIFHYHPGQYLNNIYHFIHPSISPSIHLSIYSSIHSFIHPFIYLSIYLSIYKRIINFWEGYWCYQAVAYLKLHFRPTVQFNVRWRALGGCLFVRLSVYLVIYLPFYLSIHLSIFLSIYLYIYLSIHISIYLSINIWTNAICCEWY